MLTPVHIASERVGKERVARKGWPDGMFTQAIRFGSGIVPSPGSPRPRVPPRPRLCDQSMQQRQG